MDSARAGGAHLRYLDLVVGRARVTFFCFRRCVWELCGAAERRVSMAIAGRNRTIVCSLCCLYWGGGFGWGSTDQRWGSVPRGTEMAAIEWSGQRRFVDCARSLPGLWASAFCTHKAAHQASSGAEREHCRYPVRIFEERVGTGQGR